jgi:hypothetical protein
LKLNFQYAAVVRLGLPDLVDDRFAVGVGERRSTVSFAAP